ncbi:MULTISPECIES: arsenate reductase ArsC [Marisediminitalea]|jgi:arsenate reductase|uniref:arsenate reductase ArsC n=1 Tax=Marisediminitalea TaxID=2662254 RepID=UPI0020CE325A|nr:arsenate reductase ArsC [Marisediminitalea aggregata]MCP3863299.1 arsenate reductase ArsC [Aestuariibacter sp.]MCP4236476.1 arsenate reductase ArsC [Aestuariibacter sp.]MCP4529072.1 arsenate reductase ArsC [Aestuariibacter sp.]MCP4949536.1 arsenate reductase ArsC [Aestuariibacter sp.]MCP5011116.1 arsenate reductase ArsC [Aestuariibacter sp.]
MKVLYICTHNRCRSILSEAITNHVAGDVITAKSAGSQPAGEVHPLSLKYLNEAGVLTEGLKSQSWDEFEAFAPDLVITVCDSAAGESCPVWFGKSVKVHWGLSDPSKLTGNEEDIARAFNDTIAQISARVTDLKTIAEQPFTPDSLRASLAKLGAQ